MLNIKVNDVPISETQFVAILEGIARRLAAKFRFGYHDIDDMKQQAKLYALEGLENYDGKRPLENFLYVHTRNRLCNYKRDNYERHDRPCKDSPEHDEETCAVCQNWKKRNAAKKNLMRTIDFGEVNDEHETNMKVQDVVLDEIVYNELLELIDSALAIDLRKDYLRLRSGVKIPKARRKLVQEAVAEIIGIGDE